MTLKVTPSCPSPPPLWDSEGGGGAQMGCPPVSMRSHDFWGGCHVTLKVTTPRCPSPPPPLFMGFRRGGANGGHKWGLHPRSGGHVTLGGGGSCDPQGHPQVLPPPPYGISRGGGGAQMGSPPTFIRSRDLWGWGGGHMTSRSPPPGAPPPPHGILKRGGRGTNGVPTCIHEVT